jgi:hypothetical protein
VAHQPLERDSLPRLRQVPRNSRYDKTKESYLGFVALASIKLWIPFVDVA